MPACEQLIDELRSSNWPGTPLLVVVTDSSELAATIPVRDGLIAVRQVGGAVSTAFRSSITAQAFGINSDDVIVARDVVGSIDALERLAQRALEEADHEIVRGCV